MSDDSAAKVDTNTPRTQTTCQPHPAAVCVLTTVHHERASLTVGVWRVRGWWLPEDDTLYIED